MSEAMNSIQQGLNEALNFAKGKQSKAVVHNFSPIDVKATLNKGVRQNRPSVITQGTIK